MFQLSVSTREISIHSHRDGKMAATLTVNAPMLRLDSTNALRCMYTGFPLF